jgi:hypothetical protein
MIKPTITPDDAVALLNDMLRLDSSATAIMIGVRQPVNDALAQHPDIQAHGTPEGVFLVGMLGVINGLFGASDGIPGWGAVTAVYDKDGNLDRFVRTAE